MAVTTWEEALEGMTPQEVWALRKIRIHLRRFLLSEGVEYSTRKPRFKDGYGGLDRLSIPFGKTDHVIRADDVPEPLAALFLALDETIHSFGGEMDKPQEG